MRALLALLCTALLLGAAACTREWADKAVILPPTMKEPEIEYPCEGADGCSLLEFTERNNVCALLVRQGGEIVFHRTFPEREDCAERVRNQRFGIASVTKSVASILLGKLMQEGEIDADAPVAAALAPAGLSYPREDLTVRDLLRMSSGMVWSESEQGLIRIEKGADGRPAGEHRTLVEAVRDRLKTAHFEPDRGGRPPFNYSGFDSQLLGIIAETLLPGDMTLADYLEAYLWPEIGALHRAEWKTDFEGRPAAYCCSYMALNDLGRLGQWVLDQHTDPEADLHDWIETSVTDTRVSTRRCSVRGMKQHFRYGYQWWVLSGNGNGFTGLGRGGQFLHVFPEQDTVVVQLSVMKDDSGSALCESMLVHRLLAELYAQSALP